MGKIVKVCSTCDESFAEKFGFCPNCGQTLQAFEMSPVAPPQPIQEAAIPESLAAPVSEIPIEAADEPVLEVPAYEADKVEAASEFEADEIAAASTIEADEPEVIEPERVIAPKAEPVVYSRPAYADGAPGAPAGMSGSDDGFYVTVIEEKNGAQRNGLILASFGFMIFVLLSAVVINLFSKDLEVGSINDDIFNAVIVEDVPSEVEEAPQPKEKKDAGGGGGGGRNEQEETTQGDLADQAKNPTRPPDAKVFRSDNFELKTPPPQTEGNRTFEKKFDRWGDPNGRFASFSNGTGTGGGQGSGTGTGQGSGRGTGAGSGSGSGSGGGLGSGNGNGTGGGNEGDDGPPPKPKAAGVTRGLAITGKPRPGYTDAARTANVQGTVILRVTFLASGQIGSISPVKGLPNGLTEQAIAAARRISFTPKTVDGVPQSVTKQIEYTFSIY